MMAFLVVETACKSLINKDCITPRENRNFQGAGIPSPPCARSMVVPTPPLKASFLYTHFFLPSPSTATKMLNGNICMLLTIPAVDPGERRVHQKGSLGAHCIASGICRRIPIRKFQPHPSRRLIARAWSALRVARETLPRRHCVRM